jgi:hypothetical protein
MFHLIIKMNNFLSTTVCNRHCVVLTVLQEKCQNYQAYIERLTTRILLRCPEILCVDQ